MIYRSTRFIEPLEIGDKVTKNMGYDVKLIGNPSPSHNVTLSNSGKLSSRPYPCGGKGAVIGKGTENFGRRNIPFIRVKTQEN